MKRGDVTFTTAADWRGIVLKIALLFAFVYATNAGFTERFELLWGVHRYTTLVPWLIIWGMSLGAIVIAAFQPSRLVRLFWAVVLSLSTALGTGYAMASGSDMSIFDVLILWNARHESGRALDFYYHDALWALVVFAIGLVLLMLPPSLPHGWLRRLVKWFGWTPVVPVAVIASIVFTKNGGGSEVIPRQFQTLALGVVAGTKLATNHVARRHEVQIAPANQPAARNIVLLVGESVRGDYIDWKPGNPYTPQMAALRDRFVDFGPASSGGNCSNTSNAILRLGGTRHHLTRSVNTNPTIWQYAKRAGYHTVYIDGQSGFIKNPGKMQNYMTMAEAADIDEFVTFDSSIPTPQLDFRVLKETEKRLHGKQPLFIYANKEGAHFPYDEGYPASATIFKPTVASTGVESGPNRVDSYRNVVRWSVDGFFRRLFDEVDLKHTAIIYTSDHGQNLIEGRFTHCSMENPDPREGLVPLLAITGDPALKARFEKGAALNRGHASHFAITPTLLELFGYAPGDVLKHHDASLFERDTASTAFAAGDIFGLFRDKPLWTKVDLSTNYKEAYSDPKPTTSDLAANASPVPQPVN